jgi:predicted Zn-dependent peptidase
MAVTFKRATLDNGLTVIGEVDPAAHTSAVGFFVKTGARDEAAPVMGVSHFLEHMMFKGTPKRSGEEVNRAFDAMGARANAYTSTEMTAFYASVLPEFLTDATELLADMMRPALRDEDFSTEKGVILEEIAMYKDEPVWVLYDALMDAYFAGSPLGHRVLGTSETIQQLQVPQMRDYFAARYSSDNTTVALTGRVDFDATVAQLAALCGTWRRTGAGQSSRTPGPTTTEQLSLIDAKLSRAYRMMVCPGPSSTDDARYAAFVAAQVLGGADNSRFHWSLVETGLIEEAECSYEPMDGLGVFRTMLVGEPDQLKEAWPIALRDAANLAESLTPKDVEIIRSKVATGVVVAGERPEGRMHRLGRQWLYHGSYTPMEEELARVNAVTVDQVRDLLAKMPIAPGAVGTLAPAPLHA